MGAVSPGGAAVRDMATDHGRLYVAMVEKFLDRADSVAPPSGYVVDKLPLWVTTGHAASSSRTAGSGPGEDIGAIDRSHPIGIGRSPFGFTPQVHGGYAPGPMDDMEASLSRDGAQVRHGHETDGQP